MTMISSACLAILEGALLWNSADRMLQSTTMAPALAPSAITQGLAVLASLRTLWIARK
jgi:hypothetical protein